MNQNEQDKIMETIHTISNPLVLTWDDGYKVNKPNQGPQALVSIEVAEEILTHVTILVEQLEAHGIHSNAMILAKEVIKENGL